MTTKEYLRQIRFVDMRIDNKLEQVERLKSKRESITTILSDMPRGGSGEDRLNAMTCRIWELEKQIDEDIDTLYDLKQEARERIEDIQDDRYRAILEAKYLNGHGLKRIADTMKYDFDWVRKLHGYALLAYEKTTHKHTS